MRAGGVEVRWACARRRHRAVAFAEHHGIPHATDSITEVLADPFVGSVSIATPHALHAELVEVALRAGRHVLVEKPIALVGDEGARLAELAERAGLVLCVVSQYRHDPVVTAVREWVTEGLLGTPLLAHASLECQRAPDYYLGSDWRGTWSGEGGSALINQGYHCLDVLRFLCGGSDGPVTVVHAAVAGRGPLAEVMQTEDTLAALLTLDGIPATVSVTVAGSASWRSRVEIVGQLGSVTIDLTGSGLTLSHCAGNPQLVARCTDLPTGRCPTGAGSDGDRAGYRAAYRRQLSHFARAMHSETASGAEARNAVAMLCLVREMYQAAGLVNATEEGIKGRPIPPIRRTHRAREVRGQQR